MKKNLMFAMFGAIALIGAVGISSCSSNDDVTTDVNPNYDPATQTVNTKFVLNINPAEQGTTRQAAATVQKANNFRGMQDAKLIGLSTGKTYDSNNPTYWLAPFAGSSTGYVVNKSYNLGTLYATGSVDNSVDTTTDPDDYKNASTSSHRVVELTLPLKTDAMLVYGRAIPVTKTGTSDIDKEENGSVIYNVNTTPENTTFTLVPRMSDANATAYTQCCELAAAILNRILKSEIDAHDMPNPVTEENKPITRTNKKGSYTQQADLSALTWRGIGALSDEAITALAASAPLQENLAKAYSVIRKTYLSTAAVNSGSAASICNMMKDVYSVAKSVADAVATNDDELNAQLLADEIIARIGNYFNIDETDFPFKSVGTASNPSTGTLLYSLKAAGITVTGFTAVNDNNFPTFPKSFNVPEGVAQLDFTDFNADASTGGFIYKTQDGSASLIDLNAKLNPTKYMYPSELLYFDNSLLRVSDEDKEANDYPDGYNKWDDTSSWPTTEWTTGPVTSGTRSVAVKNNINYGVAMLQSTVAIDNTVTTGFLDNHPENSDTDDENDVKLTAEQIGKFVLTGVLIGGQYKQVGWNYLTNSAAATNSDYVIYDNKVTSNGATIAASTATTNYTLVFDNYTTEAGGQKDVLVALEFKNGNDVDIYGKGGIIPKGGTFYLAAKLELGNKAISTWPTTYAIPPYDEDTGASKQITRIFTQDYVTTATFKIGENSLKYAYTTVPDLRASQTSLGLSVDLNWREGIDFTVELGR